MVDGVESELRRLELELGELLKKRSYEEAHVAINQLISLRPDGVPYLLTKAQILQAQGALSGAIEVLHRILCLDNKNLKSLMILSGILRQEKNWSELISTLEKAREDAVDPNLIASLATAYCELKQFDKAIALLSKAILETPKQATLLTARGSVHRARGDLSNAELDYEVALALAPNSVAAVNNLAVIKRDQGKYQEAIDLFTRALEIDSSRSEIYYNRGNAYSDLRLYKEALADYKLSTEKGSNPAYYNNYANALKEVNPREAIKAYTQAIKLNPSSARPYRNRATVHRDLFQYADALNDYQRAYDLEPDYDYLLGDLLHTRMLVSEWSEFQETRDELARRIATGMRMTSPFPLVALVDEPSLQRKASELYGADKFSPKDPSRPRPQLRLGHIKRLGFYSADFHNHATMHLMEGLLEELAGQGYELYAFSFGIPKVDPYKKRIEELFTRVYDVHLKSDQDIGELSRALGIDIAFDLKGFTQNCRPTVFAERLAPVHINYLGYPGTTGLPYMDYIITDDYLAPPGAEAHYSEKLIRLSGCYQPNNSKRPTPPITKLRSDYGLPENAFVFASFNNNYKITPDCFDVWMRILHETPKGVLWLFCDNDLAWTNLLREAVKRELDPSRLLRANRCSAEENLARQQLADLFLDSWPCGGHTTASDAIWMGLPFLTMEGASFCSRVPGSLLTTLGASSLIARSAEDYIKIAKKIASDAGYRRSIQLFFSRPNVLECLYDTKAYANDFIQKLSQLVQE